VLSGTCLRYSTPSAAGQRRGQLQGGGDIDPNQELIAHGRANILSGLFGGFLVVGSLSKISVAIAVLGQLPGTEAYRHPEARTFPGLLIWASRRRCARSARQSRRSGILFPHPGVSAACRTRRLPPL
jgi:hypothetical protein